MVSPQNRKKVLFLLPAKEDSFVVTRVHMGLTLMAGTLSSAGHDVRVVDYAFLRGLRDRFPVPCVEDVIADFRPDVVGISVFTYLFEESKALIESVSRCTEAPIILGGPHFSIFPDEFQGDRRVSYIVRGEADVAIRSIVESATRQEMPVAISARAPQAGEIPEANLDAVLGVDHAGVYQIQLSRGCPYRCSFCNIEHVAGHLVRARDIEVCLDQIRDAKRRFPGIKQVAITDDCPTFNKSRFKQFLRLFAEMNLGMKLWIDNVRANFVDEELLDLYKAAGGENICLGVESGDPDVFAAVNKGETLDEIVVAARQVKAKGLRLGLCFVIGLPGDNLLRHKNSVRLAQRLEPDYVFWNMCIPWPGTSVYDWFLKNGRIGEPRGVSTVIDPRVHFNLPTAWTDDFSIDDRVSAWLGANMSTHVYFTKRMDFFRLLALALRYRLVRPFLTYCARSVVPSFLEFLYYLPRGVVNNLRRRGSWHRRSN